MQPNDIIDLNNIKLVPTKIKQIRRNSSSDSDNDDGGRDPAEIDSD